MKDSNVELPPDGVDARARRDARGDVGLVCAIPRAVEARDLRRRRRGAGHEPVARAPAADGGRAGAGLRGRQDHGVPPLRAGADRRACAPSRTASARTARCRWPSRASACGRRSCRPSSRSGWGRAPGATCSTGRCAGRRCAPATRNSPLRPSRSACASSRLSRPRSPRRWRAFLPWRARRFASRLVRDRDGACAIAKAGMYPSPRPPLMVARDSLMLAVWMRAWFTRRVVWAGNSVPVSRIET